MEPAQSIRRRSRRPALTRGDERELGLLEVADRLLAEGTFESASLGEIAAAAGISRPTFYFYFDSKQALLVGVVERTLDALTGQITEAITPAQQDPQAAMRSLMRAVADLWWNHRGALLAAAELAGSAPTVFERIRQVIDGPAQHVGALLYEVGSNDLTKTRKSSVRLARQLGWMAERNFYVLARENPSKRELNALADELARVMLAAAGYAG